MPKRSQRLIGSILLFVMLQIAWFCLLGIWIYWFVATYITFTEISERVYPQIDFNPRNVASLVGGLVLLVGLAGGISVLFGKLRRQLKITGMYDSFIANMTHELKSPLASIQIHLETLLSRRTSPRESRGFLELMLKDAARLDKHITSILQIAGLEERRATMHRSSIDADALFRGLFEDSCDRFGVAVERRRIEGSAPGTVRADEQAMEIVVDNLVDNAVKYSPDRPRIELFLEAGRRQVAASITDHGIGIGAASQKELFRKFVRLEHPESPSVKGTGLGLYWAKEIVRQHGGRLTVQSAGSGTGTTFTIELPLASDRRSRSRRRDREES